VNPFTRSLRRLLATSVACTVALVLVMSVTVKALVPSPTMSTWLAALTLFRLTVAASSPRLACWPAPAAATTMGPVLSILTRFALEAPTEPLPASRYTEPPLVALTWVPPPELLMPCTDLMPTAAVANVKPVSADCVVTLPTVTEPALSTWM